VEALRLLRNAQQRYPGDFWLNLLLGIYWDSIRPQEAIGYYRVAVVLRPASDQAYAMLGRALYAAGDVDEAIGAYQKAIALNPNCSAARDLAKALAPRLQLEEARAIWERALEQNPPDHEAWYGYAQLCLYVGNEQAYQRARTSMLERFRDSASLWWVIAERTSVACLLKPASEDELHRAVVLADQAVAASEKPNPGNPHPLFLKGLAEYRQGQYEQAIPLLTDAAEKLPNRPGPRLVLAMAQFQSGSTTEARKTLAEGVAVYNWMPRQADHPTAWVSHVLRREAEAMILPNLTAFLQGKSQPRDNDERLSLTGICQFQSLYGTAAQLYADAFAADPDLAERSTVNCLDRAARETLPVDQDDALRSECRYLAARCAALAGCGSGADGAKISEAERTRWRKQARQWFRSDLDAWTRTLDARPAPAREMATRMLMLWQADPDFAALREPMLLNKLPRPERAEWIALWRQIGDALARNQDER
jgi:serine/threonine-protein kinase